jgi:hypothetical protein
MPQIERDERSLDQHHLEHWIALEDGRNEQCLQLAALGQFVVYSLSYSSW